MGTQEGDRSLITFETFLKEGSCDGVYKMLLPSGAYAFVSPSFEKIFGYRLQQWYDTPKFIFQIIGLHPQNTLACEWEKLLLGDIPDACEYPVAHADGSIRWIYQRNRVEKDQEGNVTAIDGLITDVTVYKKVQEELRQSEKRFYDIFYRSPDPVLIIENNRFIDCNQAAVDALKYKNKKELLNVHPSELSPSKQPDGRDSYAKAEAMMRIARENGSNRFKWLHRRFDGSELFVEVTLTLIELGSGDVIYGHWKDMGELDEIKRELEENRARFLEFARTSFDWVWEVDADGVYTYASPRVEDFLGYTPEEIIGKTPFELMRSDEARRVGKVFTEYVDRRQPFNFLLNENIHKDGTSVYLETSGIPVFDAGGEFIGYRGTDRDVTKSVQNQHALEKIVEQYNAVVETTKDGYWVNDSEANILEVNDAYCRMSGYSRAELKALKISDIEAAETAEETKKHIENIIKEGGDTFETKHRRKNGEIFNVEISVSYSRIEGGRFFVFVRDISNRKAAENEWVLASQVFATMTDGVVITDADQNIIRVNEAFLKITGYEEDELIGENPSFIKSGWHDKAFYDAMWHALNTTGNWSGEIVDRKKSGAVYTAETSIVALKNKENVVTNYIAVSSDISDKKEQEKIINNLAYYDVLTGLPNRIYFEEQFNSRVAAAKRTAKKLALLFIDLDNFKTINDTHGHLVGDDFLREAAHRIERAIREEDVLGRFGGDEFAIMVEDFDQFSDLAVLSNKIVGLFDEPFELNSQNVYSGASIGISVFPDNGKTYHELMRTADTAMYDVKESGKSGYRFYLDAMNRRVSERMFIENALVDALGNGELHVAYQPKVDLVSKRVYGMEALLRWTHPSLGLVDPEQFIPLAEAGGRIYEIGLWVLKQALSDTKALHDSGHDLIVSINVSHKQLENENFIHDLIAVIDGSGVQRECIELEITETQIMSNVDMTLEKLNEIARHGIAIAIDDFGTGYSSLSYLKKLPINTIKIDKSFVLNIDRDEDDRSIVSIVIALAQALNKSIIAEGSETKEHIDTLLELQCTKVQGYYFSKPLKFSDFKAYVAGFGSLYA